MSIILYLLQIINDLYQQNAWLIQYMCKYLPLKQWAYDDSHSPKYQKFKTDELPKIVYTKQDWNWKDLNKYYTWRLASQLNLSNAVALVTFRTPAPAHTVTPLPRTFIVTMAKAVSCYARFVESCIILH